MKSTIAQQKYNEPSKANILKVYDVIEKNQIFGTRKIAEILDCSPSTARAVMTKLRDMEVVKAVNGKGKGKYVFIDQTDYEGLHHKEHTEWKTNEKLQSWKS